MDIKNGRIVSDIIYNAKLDTPAIDYCNDNIILNNGYLPSLYELSMIYENKNEIENCINDINGAHGVRFMQIYNSGYCSSIQATKDNVWGMDLGSGNAFRYSKNTNLCVMVLTEFA